MSPILDQLLALFILVAFFLMIYLNMRKQSITDMIKDLRDAFGGNKDVGNRPERYYK